MADVDSNPYAPPRADVEGITSTSGPELASRGVRFLASLVDGLLIGVVLWVAVFVALRLAMPGRDFFGAYMAYAKWTSSERFGSTTALVAGQFAIFLTLNGYLLARHGQTLGKMFFGISIIRSDGEPASLGRLIGLRYGPIYLVYMVPLLGGLVALIDPLCIFRASRRCLHDSVADTIVVGAASLRGSRTPGASV